MANFFEIGVVTSMFSEHRFLTETVTYAVLLVDITLSLSYLQGVCFLRKPTHTRYCFNNGVVTSMFSEHRFLTENVTYAVLLVDITLSLSRLQDACFLRKATHTRSNY